MDTISAFITLLFVMDPLGNIPVFLSILKDVDEKRRQWILARELIIALVVLLIFLWGGEAVLNLLGLRQESISIAGAIILFLIAIRMIFPSPYGLMGETPEGEPFIVPLAIPMVAGPSALAISMLMVTSDPGWQAYQQSLKDFGSDSTVIIVLSDDQLFTACTLHAAGQTCGLDIEYFLGPGIELMFVFWYEGVPGIGTLQVGQRCDL